MVTGFVIGKFYPLHLGHTYLLDVAQSHCDRLIVCVCDKVGQDLPGAVRAAWIRELHPEADVRVIPDTLPDGDSRAWAEYTVRILGSPPDVVFTSEDYGPAYARLMGSRHVMVDRARTHTPVSGTAVRADALSQWEFLAPPVRAYYAKRVVVLGAESTGTTTLAQALAGHFGTVWVPEYGREYTERKVAQAERSWSSEEFVHIAAEQARREDEAARHANRLLVCDTDPWTTMLWHERYLGRNNQKVADIARGRRVDLYLLTGDEIPFVQDGTRDGVHIRHAMHRRFRDRLQRRGVPFSVLIGSPRRRLERAVELVRPLLL